MLSFFMCFLIFSLCLATLSHPLQQNDIGDSPMWARDLVGLLDDDDSISSAGSNADLPHNTQTTSNIFGGILASTTKPSKTTTTSLETTLAIGAQSTSTPSITNEESVTHSSSSSSMSAPTIAISTVQEAPTMPPGEATEWKVIGVAIIAISFVATVILSIVFFDSWWGFIRDLVLGKKKHEGSEDMVPDWQRRSWEFKLANEDGHRYPTLASMECMKKESLGKYQSTPNNLHSSTLTPPKPSYLPEQYPHPLEPLVRRPSIRSPKDEYGGLARS